MKSRYISHILIQNIRKSFLFKVFDKKILLLKWKEDRTSFWKHLIIIAFAKLLIIN